jgi:hypothetical protein
VANSIKDCLLNIIPREHTWKITLFQNWENIIGSLKTKVIIEKIKDDILFLGVTHPAWAQELHLLSPILKTKVNACLGQEKIKSIRITLINVKSQKQKPKFDKCGQDNLSEFICKKLSNPEQNVLNSLTDNDLRNIMHEFYLRCKNVKGRSR